jgi:tripartite-type tricarboxylate transporter receptor subunit TctC
MELLVEGDGELARPEIQARFQGYGAAARGSSPEELAKLIAEEVPKWRSTVESAQITAQ